MACSGRSTTRDGMEVFHWRQRQTGDDQLLPVWRRGGACEDRRVRRREGLARNTARRPGESKTLVQTRLWDREAQFFKTLPRDSRPPAAPLRVGVDVRELHGYTPWYFNLPDRGYEQAWKQLMDPRGFYAPFGPTTAEQKASEIRRFLPGPRMSVERTQLALCDVQSL